MLKLARGRDCREAVAVPVQQSADLISGVVSQRASTPKADIIAGETIAGGKPSSLSSDFMVVFRFGQNCPLPGDLPAQEAASHPVSVILVASEKETSGDLYRQRIRQPYGAIGKDKGRNTPGGVREQRLLGAVGASAACCTRRPAQRRTSSRPQRQLGAEKACSARGFRRLCRKRQATWGMSEQYLGWTHRQPSWTQLTTFDTIG